MLSCLFLVLLILIFGKLGFFALRATWGITKVLFTIVFLPLILIGMLASGLLAIAFPILIIIGIAALFTSFA